MYTKYENKEKLHNKTTKRNFNTTFVHFGAFKCRKNVCLLESVLAFS